MERLAEDPGLAARLAEGARRTVRERFDRRRNVAELAELLAPFAGGRARRSPVERAPATASPAAGA
jgi:hypothetical protein